MDLSIAFDTYSQQKNYTKKLKLYDIENNNRK